MKLLRYLLFLSVWCGLTTAQVLTPNIDGATDPGDIPDSVAQRLTFMYLASPTSNPDDLAMQYSRVGGLQLINQSDMNTVISNVNSFYSQYQTMVTNFNNGTDTNIADLASARDTLTANINTAIVTALTSSSDPNALSDYQNYVTSFKGNIQYNPQSGFSYSHSTAMYSPTTEAQDGGGDGDNPPPDDGGIDLIYVEGGYGGISAI